MAGLLLLGISAPTQAIENTISVDNKRTGWDANEPKLSPSQVSSAAFGQRWSTALNGFVSAQPLVTGKNVVVATENNYVYGIDAVTGQTNWARQLGPAWPTSAINCGNSVSGITSTPVYDSSSNTVYLTSKANDGVDVQHPHWYIHALSATSGAERAGWPVTIQGTPTNSPGHPFNPFTALQRPGLLLMNGSVYAGFGSYCDHGPYVGQVVGVNVTSHKLTMWSAESGSDNKEAGIWQSGGGLVSDGSGRIFLSTGNGNGTGASPNPGPGDLPPAGLGESVVRLGVNSDGSLSAKSFFSPANNRTLDATDTDIGSGGPVALPNSFGTTAHPRLLVQPTKDGRIFLLDRDHLGGMGQGPNGTDHAVSMAGPFQPVFGHPGVWGGDGGYVYTVAKDSGSGAPLRALKYSVNSAGTPTLTSVGISNEGFGYGSTSPIVTSSGMTHGSALVWIAAPGQLRVYDAVPVNGIMHLRRTFPIGNPKWAPPATDGGRVYVATTNGQLVAFGTA
ncbi:PQQ-binding-like beta-propeller repeat protein [Streptomyces sp. NPDC051133]|uniref:outer membrane protein assembly factor BamB family protein n=1 Tax=Streptomyces sp. NPDC051133 TaxID=3155521 RepID=UPI0034402CE0